MSTTDIMQLSMLKGTPLEYTISADHPLVKTPLGDVQIGSILSYQVQQLLHKHIHVLKDYTDYRIGASPVQDYQYHVIIHNYIYKLPKTSSHWLKLLFIHMKHSVSSTLLTERWSQFDFFL